MNHVEGVDWDRIELERIEHKDDLDENSTSPKNDYAVDDLIKIGMEFNSLDDVWSFWRKYGKKQGFGVRKHYGNKRKIDGVISSYVFVCYKEGVREDNRVKDKSRQRYEVRTNCKVRLTVKLDPKNGKYIVKEFEGSHNHVLETGETIHHIRSCGEVSAPQALAKTHDSGITPKATHELSSREAGGREKLGFIKEDQKIYQRNRRMKEFLLGELGSIVRYFQEKKCTDSYFSHDFQFDACGMVSNIFWLDGKMKADYADFGDVITFDTTYGTNKELRPLGVFTGFNHHREILIFGAALLYDETIESFVWLFETFLRAHGGKNPITIFTDQDAAMANALGVVMPNAYHGLCTWHLNQNALRHLSCYQSSEYDILGDFSRCMYEYPDVDEFEEAWNCMLEKHGLTKNSWLEQTYALKKKWAKCFMKHSFTLGIRTAQLSESLNKDLKNHLNCALNATDFFRQFDIVVADTREAELGSEFRARQQLPLLCIPECPILQQTSKRYTPSIFSLFQDEYRLSSIAMIKDKDKSDSPTWFTIIIHGKVHKEYRVVRADDGCFSCSCKMFEGVGYICSHVLRVFRFFDIFEIPERYILSRWERRARRLHNLKAKDIGENNEKWTERMQSKFLRMIYQAAKTEVSRGLLEKMFDENVDKIYDASMGEEIANNNEVVKLVENTMAKKNKTSHVQIREEPVAMLNDNRAHEFLCLSHPNISSP